MKVVATPGNIYHVEGWTNATPVDTLITHATVSVGTEDMSASANFTINPILTIEVNDTTAGNIKLYQEDQEATLPEGIVAYEENEEVVPGMFYVFPGTEVTVEAKAKNLYHVNSWTNADHQRYTTGIADSLFSVTEPTMFPTLSRLTLTVVSDTHAMANLELNGYLVDVESGGFATYYSDKPLTLSPVETNAAVYTVASVADSIVVLSEALGEIPSMTPLLVHNR